MKNIPNYISISRIIMSIALLIPKTFSIPYLLIYTYCCISDMLDGFLARKYKIISELGSKIDSIVDIIFVVIPLLMGVIDIAILEILICSIATFSAIQEGYYIMIKRIN